MHRLHQFIDVAKALGRLRARRVHVKPHKFLDAALKQKPGKVYRAVPREAPGKEAKTAEQ